MPTALLVALCMPPDLDSRWAEQLADGLAAEAALVGAAVVGGDMSASPVMTDRGDRARRPRGPGPGAALGARPGDVVAMAGRIGHAAAG